MKVRLALVLLGAISATALPGVARAASAEPGIIVRYAAGTEGPERAEAREEAQVAVRRHLLLDRAQLVAPEPGVRTSEAAALLNEDPAVAWAEPDRVYELAATPPDDPYWEVQWGLENRGGRFASNGVESPGISGVDIGALSGWETAYTGAGTITAVIDSGVDLEHPDLAGRIAENAGEFPGNGKDDDANGFVDDRNGWDFVDRDADPDDEDGHGTMVAGVIGATPDNGIGVSGVGHDARILPLRACTDGGCSSARIVDAIGYARRAGARVVNMSFGGPVASRATYDAMRAASDVLFVVSAGNDGIDVDASPVYPCASDQIRLIDLPEWDQIDLVPIHNLICVAASDHRDARPSFSNWGATTVDLAAPGNMIATTHTNGVTHGYAYANGTSFAAPHVAGIAAVARSYVPTLPASAVKAGILGGAEPLRTRWVATPVLTGDRASLPGALLWMNPEPPRVPAPLAPPDGTVSRTGSIQFEWTVADRTYRYDLLLDGETVASGQGLGSHRAEVAPGAHAWQVRATNRLGLSALSPELSFSHHPETRIEIRRVLTRFARRQIRPYLWVSEPGTVRLTATAKFRWKRRAKPRKRVIARQRSAVHAGGNYPRVRLNAAGLRLRKVAPRKPVRLRVEFFPGSAAGAASAMRWFRLGRIAAR